MRQSIDLNADMGEGVGDDAALLEIVSSANIACGYHAGDRPTMVRTMRLAMEKGVAIGAHPGFRDLQGFGRRRMNLYPQELDKLIVSQLDSALEVAREVGAKVHHLKLHGALANMASEDPQIARACYEAALRVQPDIVLTVMAATAQERVARELGAAYAVEIFADRAYNPDATLVDRSQPGAVLHDPDHAATRVLEMVKAGAIIAQDGTRVPARIDTICLHGDGDKAVAMARAVQAALCHADIRICAPQP